MRVKVFFFYKKKSQVYEKLLSYKARLYYYKMDLTRGKKELLFYMKERNLYIYKLLFFVKSNEGEKRGLGFIKKDLKNDNKSRIVYYNRRC